MDEAVKAVLEEKLLENQDKKEDQMRRMAWVSLIAVIVITLIIITPGIIPVERIVALEDLISTFYIAQAGISAAFFGTTAYMTMTRNKS